MNPSDQRAGDGIRRISRREATVSILCEWTIPSDVSTLIAQYEVGCELQCFICAQRFDENDVAAITLQPNPGVLAVTGGREPIACLPCCRNWIALSLRSTRRGDDLRSFVDPLPSAVWARACAKAVGRAERWILASDATPKGMALTRRYERHVANVDIMPDVYGCPTPGCSFAGWVPLPLLDFRLRPSVFCELCKRCWTLPVPEAASDRDASNGWVSRETKPCPSCGAPTLKVGGCHIVHCARCRADWCWDGGQTLGAPAQPHAILDRKKTV